MNVMPQLLGLMFMNLDNVFHCDCHLLSKIGAGGIHGQMMYQRYAKSEDGLNRQGKLRQSEVPNIVRYRVD